MAQRHPKGIKLIRIELSLNISSMNRISLSQSFRLNFAIKTLTANMYKRGQAKRPNIVQQTVLFLNLHGQVFCIKNKRTYKKHCLYRRKVQSPNELVHCTTSHDEEVNFHRRTELVFFFQYILYSQLLLYPFFHSLTTKY